MNAHTTTTRPASTLPLVHAHVARKATREDVEFLGRKLEGLKGRASALSLAESRAHEASAALKGAADWFSFVARAAKEGAAKSAEVDKASEQLMTARTAHKAAQAQLTEARKGAVGATLRDLRVVGTQLAAAQRELWAAEEDTRLRKDRAEQELIRQLLRKRGC